MVKEINSVGTNIINKSDLGLKNLTNEFAFKSMLKERLDEKGKDALQFSKHAMKRAEERGIEVTPALVNRLEQAVDRAKRKGAKDVVIIGDGEAFIVNAPNNVVVTAMMGNELKENIFTNIDSAVLI